MMAYDNKYEKKPGDGSAFVNKEKVEEWHYPYTGEIILPNGEIHFLNVKPGKTKAGEWWFSVKIGKAKTKKADNQGDNPTSNVKPIFKSEDSDIPF
jgi:hypothetical protein